jgi:hypothetical protein
MIELLGRKEELHPDLVPYLQDNGGISGLFHPLVYNLFHTEHQNAIVNAQYTHKLQSLELALKNGDYNKFVFLHERPYRIGAFDTIQNQLKDSEYWELLADIYTDSENIWQNKALWKRLLASKRPQSDCFMGEEEREAFRALPQTLTLYRGHSAKNSIGWSYTLNKDKALWFATRFKRHTTHSTVKTLTLNKRLALGLKTCRGEDEIVLRRPK